jgi:cyclic di-GMP phosphodiesterase
MSSATAVAPDVELLLDAIQNESNSDIYSTSRPLRRTATPPDCKTPRSTPAPSAPSLASAATSQTTTSAAKILVVDDEPINVKVCHKYLRELGYEQCLGVTDSTRAMATILAERPDLIILDVMMPVVSGVDLLRTIRAHEELAQLPVLILTAASDRTTKLTVLELGASDLLAKPIDPSELAPRVRNALTIKKYHDGLRDHARALEEAVRVRTADLEASRLDVIHCLARAVEYRDDNTGRHVERVGRYTGIIGEALGLEAETCRMLQLAAQLHDVGKIGVSDDVLLKPGRLTPEEYDRMQRHTLFGKKIVEQMSDRDWEKMRQHVQIGSKILEAPRSPLLAMASRIALTHHERWDGTGYPLGLAGEDIPLEGRITAVADVFDALSSRRPYKPAFSLDKCFEIIGQERGSHFDPRATDAFFSQRERIVQTQIELADPE